MTATTSRAVVLTVDLTGQPADPVAEWLVDGSCRLFEEFRALLEPAPTTNAVVVSVVAPADPGPELAPVVEAVFGSVQAITQSLALEYPGTRLTVLRSTPDQAAVRESTADFLASADGAYVTAATIDLRSAS